MGHASAGLSRLAVDKVGEGCAGRVRLGRERMLKSGV